MVWPDDETHTTREAKGGVAEASRVGLSSWKSRKCARWLVPSCASKPSAVRVRSGKPMMPALLMRMCSLEDCWRKASAHERTDWRELRSSWRRETRPSSRMSPRTVRPLLRSRTVAKMRAPVDPSARAVSMPRPDEQPVMRMVLSDSLLVKSLSRTISRAVGRASPGPVRFLRRCTSA